jgi:serine/threonine-protein kinase
MEFLDGASLSTLLEKGIDRVNAIRVALAVAEALAAVHRRGLVHRDIKPENVMLALNAGGGGGRLVDWLKLIDFGLALKAGKVPPMPLGTPEFCGPEQFTSQEVAHPANDVYALGVTIFLMMTGVFPFDGPKEELPHLHLTQPPPGLVDTLVRRFGRDGFDPRTQALLEDLDELLQQMLAKRAHDRPSAQDVAARLIRLESSFAEAGTFVGSAPAITLTEQAVSRRRKSGTSVLTRAHAAQRASSSATAPDVQVVTQLSAPAVEAVAVSSAPALQAVAARPAQTPSSELSAPKSNRGVIIGLVLLVMVLATAVVVLGAPPPPPPEDPPKVLASAPVRIDAVPVAALEPVTPMAVVDAGEVDAGAPEEDAGAPPSAVDAGLVETDELSMLAPVKAPKSPRAKGCRYDGGFEKAARLAMSDLQRGATSRQNDELVGLGVELHQSFKLKDCKGAEAVLKRMRAVRSAK